MKYYCDIDYDVFQFMNENDILYGFTLSMFEYSHTIPTLWEAFRKFMSMNSFTAGPLFKFVENGDHTYNLCHFWTNFEIADMNIFRGSKYQSMFKYLDETGGFYYERWGDAPIHTLFVLTFLDPEEVWWFGDIGYTHSPYTQCPRATEIRDMGKCSCDPNTDFLFHELSCTNHFLKNREAALSNDQFQIEADF